MEYIVLDFRAFEQKYYRKYSPRGSMIHLSDYDWFRFSSELSQSDCFIPDVNKEQNCFQYTRVIQTFMWAWVSEDG